MVARDIVATDAQLIMLLTTLVEMEERCRADAIASVGEGARRQRRLGRGGAGGGGGSGYDRDDHDHNDDDDEEDGGREGEDPFSKGLFLPGFIQVNRSLPRSFAPRRILFV